MNTDKSLSNEKNQDVRYALRTIIILVSIIAVCLVIYFVNQRHGDVYSQTADGAQDISFWDASNDFPLFMQNGWELYPNMLLEPIDFASSENTFPHYKDVSITTNGWTYIGNATPVNMDEQVSMSEFGVATYRLVLQLNTNTELVAMDFEEINLATNVWVNGQLLRRVGVVSEDQSIYESNESAFNLQISPDENGRIELIIQCANFDSPFGGITNSPAIGSVESIESIMFFSRMWIAILITIFLIVAVAGYYVSRTFHTRAKYYLFVGMMAVCIAYESLDNTVNPLPGDWNKLIQTTLLIVMCVGSYLYFTSVYPKNAIGELEKLHHWDTVIVFVAASLYIIVYWLFPEFLYLRSSIIANLIFVMIVQTYNFIRAAYMLQKEEKHQLLHLCSCSICIFMFSSMLLRAQQVIYLPVHSFILAVMMLGIAIYFTINYVNNFKTISNFSQDLERAVQEKTKYIAKVNDDLLANHQKLIENEDARKKMMSNVSHDLRTPITAIRGYVELMQTAKEPLTPEQQQLYLSNMHTRSVQMEQMISDLVQLTRMESENVALAMIPISIREMITELYSLYKMECEGTEKHVYLEMPDDEDDLMIEGDAKKLLRVFENIIVNAMKYTREKGDIHIICSRYDDPAMLGGNAVSVVVKDNGVGIPKADLPYVFDRFYRAENSGINKTGSGLGLSIVKSVIDKHGGKIWVESVEGEGSEFHIVFKAI